MRRTRTLLFGALVALVPLSPANAAIPEVSATLDGQPIPVVEVGDYACHDLEFPVIRCFQRSVDRDRSASVQVGTLQAAVATAVIYVTVWDGSNYTGASLSISQDYDALAAIGWNDKVSSLKGRNSETGRFYVDWFHGGSSWSFCCNQQTSSLGSYNNVFSSVYRT